MPNSTTVGILLLAGAMLLPGGEAARAEQTHRCASIVDDAARLACYDAEFGKPADAAAAPSSARTGTPDEPAATQTSSAAVAPTAATVVGTAGAVAASDPAAKARADFGLSEVDKRAREPQEELEPDSITSTLAKVVSRPTGELVLTLADGQVWNQIQPDARFRAKTGDSVTIRKATLGSYLMVGPDRISTRVRRVK